MRGARPVQRRKAWENELTSVYPSNQAIRETDRFPSARYWLAKSSRNSCKIRANVVRSSASLRRTVRAPIPNSRATISTRARPCGSSSAIVFSTCVRKGPVDVFRLEIIRSQCSIRSLLRYGSAVTMGAFAVSPGNSTSSLPAPNSTVRLKKPSNARDSRIRRCLRIIWTGRNRRPVISRQNRTSATIQAST